MIDFLTPAELHDLTGLQQVSAQVRWLRVRGWKFETTAHGALRVTRAYFRAKLESADAIATAEPTQVWAIRPGLALVK